MLLGGRVPGPGISEGAPCAPDPKPEIVRPRCFTRISSQRFFSLVSHRPPPQTNNIPITDTTIPLNNERVLSRSEHKCLQGGGGFQMFARKDPDSKPQTYTLNPKPELNPEPQALHFSDLAAFCFVTVSVELTILGPKLS